MQDPLFTEGYDDLSLGGRLKYILPAPSATFAAIRRTVAWPDWVLPTLLVCLSGILYHYMTGHIIFNPDTPAIQDQLQALDEARRQQALQGMETWRTQGWLLVVSGAITSLALIAGVLLAVARLIFHREVSFSQMVAVKSYASLTAGVEWLVRIPLVLMAQDPMVHLGPGVFVAKDATTTFTGQFLIGLNLFDCWQSLLLGIGLSVVAKIPRVKAVFVVFMLWLGWLAAGAFMTVWGASIPA